MIEDNNSVKAAVAGELFPELAENGETGPEGQGTGAEKAEVQPLEAVSKPKRSVWQTLKKILNHIFIDGMSGMALGLFATLIIGTIITQVGGWIGDNFFGRAINSIGNMAKFLTGAGIGVGVAVKLKKPPLLAVAAGIAGMIGAYSAGMIDGIFAGEIFGDKSQALLKGFGEPFGAFVAAMTAIEVGKLVAGKTKVDIIVTPLVGILSGAVIALLVGKPISLGLAEVGKFILWATERQPVIMGIVISVVMGVLLTLPVSSAAIGISIGLGGIAAGAATVGCCCQMIGFAVSSFRENKWGGLVAQGLGTSMLQMPNIIKKPQIWVPSILASAILGPISTAVFKMQSNAVGSGMGTAGLVGPIQAFAVMTSAEVGVSVWSALLQIGLMHFLLPALLCLLFSEIMRKLGWIKPGYMKLEL